MFTNAQNDKICSLRGEKMKTDLRIFKTKEALRDALMHLLEQKSLKSISVTELCQLAKVNRGTFYAHYGQVENLF